MYIYIYIWPVVKTPSPRMVRLRICILGYTFQLFQILLSVKPTLDRLGRPLPASAPPPTCTSDQIKVNETQEKYTNYAGSTNKTN